MNVLVIDVGGTYVKALVSGQQEHRMFDSGNELIPARMVSGVKKIADDWRYEAISIGYPGPVLHNRAIAEPWNCDCRTVELRTGLGRFQFSSCFRAPGEGHQ